MLWKKKKKTVQVEGLWDRLCSYTNEVSEETKESKGGTSGETDTQVQGAEVCYVRKIKKAGARELWVRRHDQTCIFLKSLAVLWRIAPTEAARIAERESRQQAITTEHMRGEHNRHKAGAADKGVHSDSRNLLDTELEECVDGLNMDCEQKGRNKDGPKVSGLQSW